MSATAADDGDDKTTTTTTNEDGRIPELEARITQLEQDLAQARSLLQLAKKDSSSSSSSSSSFAAAAAPAASEQKPRKSAVAVPEPASSSSKNNNDNTTNFQSQLTLSQIERYSRPLLLSSSLFGGVHGQLQLLSSSVLVVGAGGIGSTVLLYLAGAGVGHVGICDFDTVEVCNLHRQVLHSTRTVGWNKAESARQALQHLNPHIRYTVYNQEPIHHDNVLSLIQSYDCIVDCSDNRFTRYVLNDACVLAHKPLVSGSALGTEGQLTVYPNPKSSSSTATPTTTPAPPQSGRSCSDAGVLGPVPGLIGILQAVEVLKLLTAAQVGSTTSSTTTSSISNQNNHHHHHHQSLEQRMLLYDAMTCSFWTIQKPATSQPHCLLCGGGNKNNNKDDASIKFIKSMQDSKANLLQHLNETGPYQKQQQQHEASKQSVTNNNNSNELPPNDFQQVTCVEYNALYQKWRRPRCRRRRTKEEQEPEPDSKDDDKEDDGTARHNKRRKLADEEHVAAAAESTQDDDLPTSNQVAVHGVDDDDEDDNDNGEDHILLDVRPTEQYQLCSLPGSINIPLAQLSHRWSELLSQPKPVYCMCRRGNSSLAATKLLLLKAANQQHQHQQQEQEQQQQPHHHSSVVVVVNIQGGLDAWRQSVDPSFPKY
ncbi:hypothetical protein ACA910_014781 [Epithemia clementina (nom. ined.)]